MAAPTQEYPPWLTQVTTTVDGIETVSIMYLPLTYYGPSIPLGPDWTYGGLTSPASTASETSPTTAIPSTTFTTTSAIPSSSITTSAIPSSSTTLPSSSLTSTSSTSISTSSLPSSTVAPSPTSSPASSGGLNRGALIGIIVGSILGFIVFFGVAVLCFICRRTRRKQLAAKDFSILTPGRIDDDWQMVGGGDGIPRQSGEEGDPFLSREPAQMESIPSLATGNAPAEPSGVNSNTVSSNNTNSSSSGSSSAGSGYGNVLPHPTLRLTPVSEEGHSYQHQRGHILTPEEQLAIEQETVLPPPPPRTQTYRPTHRSYTPPPEPSPTLGDFGALRSLPPPPRIPELSRQSSNEEGEVVTARRVRMSDLSRGTNGGSSNGNSKRASWIPSALGSAFGGLFSGGSSRRSSVQKQEEDMEAARGLLDSPSSPAFPEMVEAGPSTGLRLLPPRGERPLSGISSRTHSSGGTVFHDAPSSFGSSGPRTPTPAYRGTSTPPPVPPIPSGSQTPVMTSSSTPPPPPTPQHQLAQDPLDDPAPRALTDAFHSSASNTNSASSRDTASSVSTTMVKIPHPPPGLGDVDLGLEDEPPAAVVEWGSREGRRTTFGFPTFVSPASDWASEAGSMHSSSDQSRRMLNTSGSSSSRRTGSSSHRRAASPALSAVGPRIESPTLDIPALSLPMPLPMPSVGSGLEAIGEERVSVLGLEEEIEGKRPKSPPALAQKRSREGSLSPLPWAGGLREDWMPM